MRRKQLNALEQYVIFQKGTEPPFTGEYDNFFENGIYVCKLCGMPLFHSQSKFKGHCGWPSFDAALQDNVKMIPEQDGIRTEIVCAACNAHLGHVFIGEGFTPANIRYCVNSVSLHFIPNDKKDENE